MRYRAFRAHKAYSSALAWLKPAAESSLAAGSNVPACSGRWRRPRHHVVRCCRLSRRFEDYGAERASAA